MHVHLNVKFPPRPIIKEGKAELILVREYKKAIDWQYTQNEILVFSHTADRFGHKWGSRKLN